MPFPSEEEPTQENLKKYGDIMKRFKEMKDPVIEAIDKEIEKFGNVNWVNGKYINGLEKAKEIIIKVREEQLEMLSGFNE